MLASQKKDKIINYYIKDGKGTRAAKNCNKKRREKKNSTIIVTPIFNLLFFKPKNFEKNLKKKQQ